MGSCHSFWGNMETAGIYAATGVVGGTYLNNKRGCKDNSKQGIVNALNTIVAQTIVNVSNSCCNTVDTTQTFTVTCNPSAVTDSAGNTTNVYEANAGCTTCISNIVNSFEAHHKLEEAQWKSGRSASVKLPIDVEYENINSALENCGLFQCKSCTLINVSQNNTINSTSSCLTTLNDTNKLKASFTQLLTQQLNNNSDVLSGLESIFGNSGSSEVVESIVTDDVISSLSSFATIVTNNIKSTQNMQFNSSTSILVNNITQQSIYNVAMQAAQDSTIAVDIATNETLDSLEKFLTEHNSLNDVGELIFITTVGWGRILSSIAGKIMLGAICILGAIVLFIFGFMIYIHTKGDVSEYERVQAKLDYNRSQNMNESAFNTF